MAEGFTSEITIETENNDSMSSLPTGSRGLAPAQVLVKICAYCHYIKSENNVWVERDAYLPKYLNENFTHGICPECFKKEIDELNNWRNCNSS